MAPWGDSGAVERDDDRAVYVNSAPRHAAWKEVCFVLARRVLPLLCIALALGAVSAANATTPGVNGRIAFASNRTGNSELYSVNADGSAERRLTWTPETEQAPVWSPDGSRIAYESDSGGRFRIWVMNADGSGQHELSPPADTSVDDMDPAWSPDGSLIAFGSTRSGNRNVWVVNADGSGLRRVSSVFGDDPTWSPDGQQLAYLGLDGIGVVGADGSDAHVVSAPGAPASGPSWSPDGSQIVFSRNNPQGFPGELYVANADGSGEHRLTSDGFENARPSWSPDGTRVVFQRSSDAPFGWSLWTIGADGTGLQQLTPGSSDLGPDWGSSQVVPEPSPPDTPTIQIFSPTDGGFYLPGMQTIAFYTCSSAVSFVVSCSGDLASGAPLDLSVPGTRTFTVRALDAQGRTATKTVSYEVVDVVPPDIDLRTPSDGATYEVGAALTVDYSCSDAGGIASCEGDRPDGSPLDTTQPGSHTFTVLAVDQAGHSRQVTATYTVVATRPPSIALDAPADGATFTLGSTVLAAYSCQSGSMAQVTSCSGDVSSGAAIDTASVGAKTFTVHAADEGGRTGTLTHAYSVVYAFVGFGAPVSSTGSLNDVKAGDSVPLKFSLAGDHGLSVVRGTTWRLASCTDWSFLGGSLAGQGRLSYTASTDRYLDAVSTDRGWKGTCRVLDLDLDDGTHHAVRVRFAG
jgi:dipeptidyl aminopeptidase/acylaminoacyl peptidase